MNNPDKVRLAALALNNLGISFIQRRRTEQSRKAFEDALTMIAAVVRSKEENSSDCILSSSIDTILSRASSAIIDITENKCSSFQIATIDDIAQIVQKLTQEDKRSTYFPVFIRMEVERTFLELCEYDDQIINTAIILYNLASAYMVFATTKATTSTTIQGSKYLERAVRLFEILLSFIESNPSLGEIGENGCGLEPLAFSILALHGLVVCSTMKNPSAPVAERYTKNLSALQEEFMAHDGLIRLFLDSSCRMAAAA